MNDLGCTSYRVLGLVCYPGSGIECAQHQLSPPGRSGALLVPSLVARALSRPVSACSTWYGSLPPIAEDHHRRTPTPQTHPLPDGWVDTSGALRAFPAALVSLMCGYEKPPPLVFRGCPTRQGDRRGEGGQSSGCRARHILQLCPVNGLYDIAAPNSGLGAVLNQGPPASSPHPLPDELSWEGSIARRLGALLAKGSR